MKKRFNDTGLCIAGKHYMADTSAKLAAIMELVEEGAYFAINRPRQYGKTTSIHELSLALNKQSGYLAIQISLEGIGDTVFENEVVFCQNFIDDLAYRLERTHPKYAEFLKKDIDAAISFKFLSRAITNFVLFCQEKVVLLIDEIDKASNNQLFLSFLGTLRDKYLEAHRGLGATFYSVILVGVHDIKSLKLKTSPESSGKLNSPWNIAIDFTVDMSFSPQEIEPMLADYAKDKGIEMATAAIAEKIYYYTSGYPYLVSKICKVADEELLPRKGQQSWDIGLIDEAFKYLVDEAYTTTLFDDMAKNLENNPGLYNLVFEVSFNGKRLPFNILNPDINLGSLYGILVNDQGMCRIHNRIFEQKIYSYMLSKQSRKQYLLSGMLASRFYSDDVLYLKNVLLGFQQFMKENYSKKDTIFLEREGRLLFLSFLKPIINGKGFDFKEPNVAEERRMNVVVTFAAQRYVVELKRWEGEAYHQKGLQQLSDYLDTYSLKEGFLLIFDFRKEKEYKEELIQYKDKQIFAVWV
ncbi:MAG: AAA-like domain-containing protein [Lewinellaceae bacterium]|nr:AAA-like domain-containing protein [Phaeodactylibacter sp.]MCB9037508.1 AAA-like domain-containing protein [Lewinellaceae bacterium]